MNKLGVFGYSRGGGSIGKVAIRDDRVKAVANLEHINDQYDLLEMKTYEGDSIK